MLMDQGLTVQSLGRWVRWRQMLLCGLVIAIAGTFSGAALNQGITMAVLLLLGMTVVGLVILIFWKPVTGLYSGVFLSIALDPTVAGDPISKYTGYFHEDLNTFAHAGIAFSPLELLLGLTTLALILKAGPGSCRLRGGSLGPHVLIFGSFLVAGYAYGIATHGDPKIGLFEIRAPFMLVMLYFLVQNMVTEPRELKRLIAWIVAGIAVLAIWGLFRFVVFFHGHAGGPDGAFGHTHEDAVFLALLSVLCLLRFAFGGTVRQKILLLALLGPAMIVMLEMQRRAAFASLGVAIAVVAIALFFRRRRLFLKIMPVCLILTGLYCAAFWHSTSKLAQPILAWRSQSLSTQLDTRNQSSDIYRINEKADVRVTILSAPLTGIGFGHPFLDIHPLPPLVWWPFQFYTPHIEVMWIWLKVGAGGFIAFWVLICAALMRAGHSIRTWPSGETGFYCLLAAVYIVMLLVYAYVDVGLANERCEILLGTMLGIIGVASRFSLHSQHPLEHQQDSVEP